MKKHFWIIGGAVIVLLALGTSTIVLATSKDTTPIDGSQTFYACMQRPGIEHAQGIVPGSILTNKTVATWPAGSGPNPLQPACYTNPDYEIVSWNGAGQPGPVGPKGDTGPQGVPGISGYQVVQTIGEHAAPNQYVIATCPGTDVVLGGGAEVLSTSANFPINDSQPTSNNHSWRASYSSANEKKTALIVWATCAKVTA